MKTTEKVEERLRPYGSKRGIRPKKPGLMSQVTWEKIQRQWELDPPPLTRRKPL